MSQSCNCLMCQLEKMLEAEVERRGSKLEADELLALSARVMASVLHGLSAEDRAVAALRHGLTVGAKLASMDAATIPQPTHQPEARVQ